MTTAEDNTGLPELKIDEAAIWKPITWNKVEHGRGVYWGGTLPVSFHSYGTPVVDVTQVQMEGIAVFDPV